MRAFIFLAGAFALFVSTPTAAQEVTPDATYGICIQAVGYTDALYVRATSVDNNFYDLVVNNYGHGYVEKGSGTLTAAGGYANFGITMTADYFLDGPVATHVILNIPLSTWYGTWQYTFLMPSGGVVVLQTGVLDADMWLCSKPFSVGDREGPNLAGVGGR